MIRRISSFALGLAVTLAAADASAQGAANAKTADTTSTSSGHRGTSAFGADAGVLVPFGSSNSYFFSGMHFLIGGVLKLEVDATPSFGITGRIGYFYGVAKPNRGFSDLPVWIGGRYYVTGGGEGLHAGVEVGLNEMIVRDQKYDGSANLYSTAEWGGNIPLGYKVGGLDIQAQLSMLAIDTPGDSLAAGVTVGYDFARF